MRILTVNTILMLVFLVQNVATNYIHTWLYAKSVRGVEKELRGFDCKAAAAFDHVS